MSNFDHDVQQPLLRRNLRLRQQLRLHLVGQLRHPLVTLLIHVRVSEFLLITHGRHLRQSRLVHCAVAAFGAAWRMVRI